MRARVVVSYDGTDYAGYQRQLDVPTVQEVLEKALRQVTQETTTVLAAGRTDAGVHAVGQVIAFDTSWRHGEDDLQRAMNAVLPPDVAVRELEEAAVDFHPRFDARTRHYRYRVYNALIRSPLARRYSLHVPYALDVEAMDEAAQTLVGEHDFATFGQPPQGEVTVRRVFRAAWTKEPRRSGTFGAGQDGETFLRFDIEANAFLYRMVRSIVGTLLDVGQGRMSLSAFEEAFASCERSRAGKTAAPHGLCLIKVTY
jgi:tRNA pseudouridine38-40 synthase